MKKFLVFDVEVPNKFHNTISSIGLCTVENNVITEEYYTLINPKCRFDPINVSINHITKKMVKDAPTFKQFWAEHGRFFKDVLIVGHGVTSDLSVLIKLFDSHNIEYKSFNFICTCDIAREYIKDIDNHRLPTLCEYFDIPLKHHHHAKDDAIATAMLMIEFNKQYGDELNKFLRTYPIVRKKKEPRRLGNVSEQPIK